MVYYVRIVDNAVASFADLPEGFDPERLTDETGWIEAESRPALGWVRDGDGFKAPPPVADPPATLTRIAKAEVWRRLTDDEADDVDAALQAAPLRLRRIFEAAQYLDARDEDYPALRAGIIAALGKERAEEVLAPTY